MDVPSWLQFPLSPIVSVRRARSHCSAGHDLSPIISRDYKQSKNSCLGFVVASVERAAVEYGGHRGWAAVPWAFPASMPSVTPPPDALSVVVHRNTISQWRLATVTTETGQPCITFSLSTTGVFHQQHRRTRPARAACACRPAHLMMVRQPRQRKMTCDGDPLSSDAL